MTGTVVLSRAHVKYGCVLNNQAITCFSGDGLRVCLEKGWGNDANKNVTVVAGPVLDHGGRVTPVTGAVKPSLPDLPHNVQGICFASVIKQL